jgi:hypothetical protein
LWILVGGNGAGKSTYYRLALEPLGLPCVNADVLARIVFAEAPEAHSYEAAQMAERQRHQLLEQGVSFCFETVYSHPSKIDFIARAKSLGYQVIMVLIHLDSTGRVHDHQRLLETASRSPAGLGGCVAPRHSGRLRGSSGGDRRIRQKHVLGHRQHSGNFRLFGDALQGGCQRRKPGFCAFIRELDAQVVRSTCSSLPMPAAMQ